MSDSNEARETRASLEALAHNLSETARKEVEALREALHRQVSASLEALGADRTALLAEVEERIRKVSQEEAESTAARARVETQLQADEKLAATEAAAKRQLEAEVAAALAVRESLEATQK